MQMERRDDDAPASEPVIVVGIPTYRRPQLLARLLQSLGTELAGQDVLVVVADNACGEEVPQLVAAMSTGFGAIRAIAVKERGITAARNALVDAAYAWAPGWQWFIMLDDDGEVLPGWFKALTDVARRTGAMATGGAVVCPLPADAGIFARNSEFALRARWPTGAVDMLGVAQNSCISREVDALIQRPWFNPAFGVSGGEDHEFFLRIKRAGGQFAWSDEAVVSEPQPPERLTGKSVLYRSLTTGITTAAIDRQVDGWGASLASTARYIALAIGGVVFNALTLRKDKTIRSLIGAAYTLGRLPGMSRVVAKRYEQVKTR